MNVAAGRVRADKKTLQCPVISLLPRGEGGRRPEEGRQENVQHPVISLLPRGEGGRRPDEGRQENVTCPVISLLPQGEGGRRPDEGRQKTRGIYPSLGSLRVLLCNFVKGATAGLSSSAHISTIVHSTMGCHCWLVQQCPPKIHRSQHYGCHCWLVQQCPPKIRRSHRKSHNVKHTTGQRSHEH